MTDNVVEELLHGSVAGLRDVNREDGSACGRSRLERRGRGRRRRRRYALPSSVWRIGSRRQARRCERRAVPVRGRLLKMDCRNTRWHRRRSTAGRNARQRPGRAARGRALRSRRFRHRWAHRRRRGGDGRRRRRRRSGNSRGRGSRARSLLSNGGDVRNGGARPAVSSR